MKTELEELRAELAVLQVRVLAMTTALEWYADPLNYRRGNLPYLPLNSRVELDEGFRARVALGRAVAA